MDSIVLMYKPKCAETDKLISRSSILIGKFKRSGVNKENISSLVSTLMIEVNKLKGLNGHVKKEIVLDLINNVIEQIDDGDEDSEFETILKTMVPHMIDSFSLMLKVNKGCACM